jgi:cyclopropane fatty-acyl-phospholipid synthase-like methyltransferase
MRIEHAPKVYLQKECPLCHSNDLKPIRNEKNDFCKDAKPNVTHFHDTWIQLMECQKCEFCFTKEIPIDPDFFPARYDIQFDPAAEAQNNFKEHILEQSFNLLKKHGRTSGELLDIGCFAGILMRYSEKLGFNSNGVELNPTMADYSKEVLGLNVYKGTILSFPCEEEKYDVITLIDVLEHLLEPREILEKCFKILKPGGQILIKVPNCHPQIFKQTIANKTGISDVGMFGAFGHINHFSQKSLNNILTEVGFKPQECIVAQSETWGDASMKSKVKNFIRKVIFLKLEGFRKITGINWGLNICTIAVKE